MKDHHIYDRVYLIGVDGAGAFFRKTATPNIDRIFKGGAVSHGVFTAIPTISAQCWGSMLHGVSPQAHRFTNGTVGDVPIDSSYPFPSIFRQVRLAYPEAVLASASNWDAINKGIIEDDLGVLMSTGDDDEVCRSAVKYITENDPKLLFVQFDSVDGAGHRYGYGAKGHLEQITYADSLIGKIYDEAARLGRLENTLFLVTADHGGSPDGNHGGNTEAELMVSFFAAGKSVIPGEIGYMEIRDAASVVTFALGVTQPGNWSSRVPDKLFGDNVPFERASELPSDGSKRYSGRKNVPTPVEEGKRLEDFIDVSGILCRFPFDGDTSELACGLSTQTEGKVYFTEGFYGSAVTLDDCEIRSGAVSLGKEDYTFCAWFRLPSSAEGKDWPLFSAVNTDNGVELSFFVSGNELVSKISTGKEVQIYRRPLPGNFEGNLFHFICSYDRSEDELCYYYDFAIDSDWYAEPKLPADFGLNCNQTVIGGMAPVTVDDLMIFDHKLSDKEIENLQRYYEQ